MMGGPKFANYPVPNTLYTSQSTFQWDTWSIISLKPNCLKASKGRREIGDTYPFYLFQSPVILFDGLVSRGGGVRKWSVKIDLFIFLCFCGSRPLDISYHATWQKTQYPLPVTFLFLFFCAYYLYLYLVTSHANKMTPLFCEIYENGFIGLSNGR